LKEVIADVEATGASVPNANWAVTTITVSKKSFFIKSIFSGLQSFDEYNGKNVPVCQLLKDKRLEFEVDIECFKAVQQLFGFETYYI